MWTTQQSGCKMVHRARKGLITLFEKLVVLAGLPLQFSNTSYLQHKENILEYHYTYSITYTDEPNIYYGIRTSKCLPEEDLKYWGSPVTFKTWMKAHKATRVKNILATYPTREAAHLAEYDLIKRQWETAKNLSLNGYLGEGEKFHVLGRKNTQKQNEAIREALLGREIPKSHREAIGLSKSRHYYLVSPSGEIFEGINIRKFCRDHKLNASNINGVVNGVKFHYRGWTASLEIHKLYIESYIDRGIHWNDTRKVWHVTWREELRAKAKHFKNKSDAILFRDHLLNGGYEWIVRCDDWKERLGYTQLAA
jgi:hypothetical protein